MKSRIWCVLWAILVFVVSVGVLAGTHWVPDGGGDGWGGGYGYGWGASSTATAFANSYNPDSGGVGWASVYVYTDQAGYFDISWDCTASGSASYTDQNGSGASGSGGGAGSTFGGTAFASISLSSPGEISTDSNSVSDPGYAGMTQEQMWFDAFSGVSANSDCGAYASIGYGANTAAGSGDGYADTGLH